MAGETILVVGGAGYIGSHMVLDLLQAGHEVIVLDNLSRGHRDLLVGGTFVEGRLHAGYFPIWSVACAVRTDLCEADELVVRMAHATR